MKLLSRFVLALVEYLFFFFLSLEEFQCHKLQHRFGCHSWAGRDTETDFIFSRLWLKYHKAITRIYKYEHKVNLTLLLAKSDFDTLIKQYNTTNTKQYNKALLKKGNAVFCI